MKSLRVTLLFALTWMPALVSADPMQELLDLFKEDAKRADAAQAVINYEAQRAYDVESARRDELLNQAPGTAHFTASGTQMNALKDPSNISTHIAPTMLNWLATNPNKESFAKKYFDEVNDLGKIGVQDFLSHTTAADEQAGISTLFAQLFLGNMTLPKIASDVSAEMGQNLGLVAAASPAVASIGRMHDMRQPPADGKGLSQMGTLEKEAQYRFLDNIPGYEGAWAAELAVTPEPGLLRELAQMQALRLYLEQENHKNMERVQALLAASNSIGIQAIPVMNSFGPMLMQMQQKMNGIQADLEQAKKEAKENKESGNDSRDADAAEAEAAGKAALGM